MSLPKLRIEADGPSGKDCIVYVDDQLVPGVLSFTLDVDANGKGADRYALLTLRMVTRIDSIDLPTRVSPELYARMCGSEGEASRLVRLDEDEAECDAPAEPAA